ncbi:hypothetical protein [Priestia koreensis]|uniref:DNA-binding protein n=1 Tax=Priestia koreensis TaxID=284581 RepID=A0A0M0L5L0_9BACI|nr:hypothetical protein [Priestia koreensis]KOO46152.1 hypothetical protein AMD01_09810 [Priestia koreensis]MCM3004196.1 hypothetical protein [Priestia koreensis]UNL83412.1 hypothetical protein IE339_14685 [Priestia koreensis]
MPGNALYYSTQEVGALLNLHHQEVVELCEHHAYADCIQVGGHWFIPKHHFPKTPSNHSSSLDMITFMSEYL